jgi:hypothetical protein
MALRIRKDGRIFCAAICPPMNGDVYIADQLHYDLRIDGAIVTYAEPKHSITGEWWWANNAPYDVERPFADKQNADWLESETNWQPKPEKTGDTV